MKNDLIACLVFLTIMVTSVSASWAFSIAEPKPGTVFHPGDKVTVLAQAAAGESVKAIWFYSSLMEKTIIDTPPTFKFTFTIDADFVGKEKIIASAKLADGSIVEAESTINVELPSNISIKRISVDPSIIFLSKLPTGSSANRVRIFETHRLGVGGVYSDGVQRQITSSAGTTYTSSNETVATVSPDGLVTAKGVGTAIVTVKNGESAATVKVVVKMKDK
jgi:hypothetical protein